MINIVMVYIFPKLRLKFLSFLPLVAYYNNTDVANLYLGKNSPKSLYNMIIYQSQTIYPLWNNLGDAVR